MKAAKIGECKAVCCKHGSFDAHVLETPWGAIRTGCPICMAAADEREALKHLDFARMNIEPEFHKATLGNYAAANPSQEAALSACLDIVAHRLFEAVLSGPCGVGKTHLACAVAKELGGAVYTMFEMALRLRQTFSPKAAETEAEVLRELCRLPFLAIDELGRSKGSDAEKAWLSHIVDKRHSRRLPTMIVTNLPLERNLPRGSRAASLEALLGGNIMSRLQKGALLQIQGTDFRALDGGGINK